MVKYLHIKTKEVAMGLLQCFIEMSWIVILLLSLSVAFGIAEALTPGFGVCGTMSIVLSVASLVLEGVFTKSVYYVLILMVFLFLLGLLLFCLFIYSAQRGALSKSPIIEKRSAIPEDYNKNYEKENLIAKVGEVVSECKPIGKAQFDGKELTVISKSKNIPVGKLVVIEEVRDNIIFVKKLKGDENE